EIGRYEETSISSPDLKTGTATASMKFVLITLYQLKPTSPLTHPQQTIREARAHGSPLTHPQQTIREARAHGGERDAGTKLTSTPRLGVSTTLPERPTPSKGQWALQPINHTHTLYKTHMSRGDIGIEPAQTPPQKEELPSVNFFKMKNQTKCLSPQWLKNYKPETLKSAEGKTKKIQLEARNHSKSCVGTKKKTGTLIRKKEQR
ncbi:hypothetical protein J6590_093097, partial [Homalodisca vitripennis]